MPGSDQQLTGERPLLRVESREQGGALLIALDGEFDLASARLVQEELDRATESYDAVILDLRRVTFMDSSGLHVVLASDQRMRESGSTLSVIPGVPQVQRLLELTGAATRLAVMADPPPEA